MIKKEETYYYPFGLTMAGISSKAAGELKNNEKTYQGQRFDNDLGLNWVQFKWRNHDPQIGRFIEIDPLSDKYVDNSTYSFSENHVTAHVELEGLEKVSIKDDVLKPVVIVQKVDGVKNGVTPRSLVNQLTFEPKHPITQKEGSSNRGGNPLVSSGSAGAGSQGNGTSPEADKPINVDYISVMTNLNVGVSSLSDATFGFGGVAISIKNHNDEPKVPEAGKNEFPKNIKLGAVVNYGPENKKKLTDSTWETTTKPSTDTSPTWKSGFKLFP